VQYGAVPHRLSELGEAEVLLVTSRRRRRWIIPKGWPIKGLTPAKTAAREAFEEAGVRGVVGCKPLGKFLYDKQLDEEGRVVVCEVTVFPLAVERQFKTWPEITERETRWVDANSVGLVEVEELRRLLETFFDKAHTKQKAHAKAKEAKSRSR
jgi:8-oxo-dGTP pyrophosphatase MutT (NUDIX family)